MTIFKIIIEKQTKMLNIKNRLPRFQFFYQTSDLIKRVYSLLFDDLKQGKRHEEFKETLQDYFGSKNCITVSSCRMGVYFTLRALKLNEGDEVIISPITIPDIINAILILKLKPVFVDLSLDSQAIDPEKIPSAVTEKTKVILVTYLSGIVPDFEKIKKVSDENSLILIEDFSQNFEATYEEKYCGTLGHVGIGSLSAGKILSSTVGGFILTNDNNLADLIRDEVRKKMSPPDKNVIFYYLKNCLIVNLATTRWIYILLTHTMLKLLAIFSRNGIVDFEHEPKHKHNIFYTFIPERREFFPEAFFVWLSDWQCDLALKLLKGMKTGTQKRRLLAKVLIENMSEKSLRLLPKDLKKVDENSFYHFPIYTKGHHLDMRKHLFDAGIDNGSYGLNLNNEEACFQDLNCDLPNAHEVKFGSIFLPINEAYSPEHLKYIAQKLNEFTENAF